MSSQETGFHNENGVHIVKEYQSRKLRVAISENIREIRDRLQTNEKQGKRIQKENRPQRRIKN